MRLWCACVVGVLLCAGCSQSVFFQPDRVVYGAPSDLGVPYERSDFTSSGGVRLSGWFIPAVGVAAPRDALGTVVQFHGNAQNMTSHWQLVGWLASRGFNVYVFDYRGYGSSEGSPSVTGLRDDGVAALRHVAGLPQVDPARMCVLGQSLGGAVALAAVTAEGAPPVAAVTIESTFASYSSIANDKLALAGVFMDDHLSPERQIVRLGLTPVMFFHGTEDAVIGQSHSERLYALATGPKAIVLVPGGGHLETFGTRFGDTYRDALVEFYRAALP